MFSLVLMITKFQYFNQKQFNRKRSQLLLGKEPLWYKVLIVQQNAFDIIGRGLFLNQLHLFLSQLQTFHDVPESASKFLGCFWISFICFWTSVKECMMNSRVFCFFESMFLNQLQSFNNVSKWASKFPKCFWIIVEVSKMFVDQRQCFQTSVKIKAVTLIFRFVWWADMAPDLIFCHLFMMSLKLRDTISEV